MGTGPSAIGCTRTEDKARFPDDAIANTACRRGYWQSQCLAAYSDVKNINNKLRWLWFISGQYEGVSGRCLKIRRVSAIWAGWRTGVSDA